MDAVLVAEHGPKTGMGKYWINLYLSLRKITGIDLIYISRRIIQTRYSVRPDFRWLGEISPKAKVATTYLLQLPILPLYANISLTDKSELLQARSDRIYHFVDETLVPFMKGDRRKNSVVTVHHALHPLFQPLDFSPWQALIFYTAFLRQLKSVARIIAISRTTKRDLVRFVGIPGDRINVVYSGVSKHYRRRKINREALHLPNDAKLILHVGADSKRKNLKTVMKVLYKLAKNHKTHLIKVGKLSQNSKNLAHQLGVLSNIYEFKWLNEEDLAKLYNIADVFLYPSLFEGFGLPVVEAMASGCPVIVSNRSSLPEIVGRAGIQLGPDDVDSWIKWTSLFLQNPEIREEFSQNSLERAKDFSWEKCAEETAKIYREIS